MVKTNYHTHLCYCNHAGGHAKDYVEEAIAAGFTEIGITDHAPMLELVFGTDGYAKPMLLDQMYQCYLPELKEAKEKYQNQIKVLSGFETEYLSANAFFIPVLRRTVDYLNLGEHFFDYKGKILSTYAHVNYETIYGYLETCSKGMKTKLFNVFVHPDLFMVSYTNEVGKKVFDAHCRYVAQKLIECAIENDIYLELNANGINNSNRLAKGKTWLYPNEEFWKIVKQYDKVKILIGSDAHSIDALTCPYVEEAEQFAKRLGLTICPVMEIHH